MSGPTRSSGVVLCYPFGHEYMRSHRAFRQLATLLTRAGFHALRFDYYATGDSAGDARDGDLTQWLDDLLTAVDELKDTAGVPTVSLVGLRLGAALAVQAATLRNDLDRLALWNPVIDGKAYVDELLNMAAEVVGKQGVRALEERADGTSLGIRGFPLTRQMRRDLGELDLLAVTGIRAKKIFIVTSERRDDYLQLYEQLKEHRLCSTYECITSAVKWRETDDDVTAVLPQETLHGLVRCLA